MRITIARDETGWRNESLHGDAPLVIAWNTTRHAAGSRMSAP